MSWVVNGNSSQNQNGIKMPLKRSFENESCEPIPTAMPHPQGWEPPFLKMKNVSKVRNYEVKIKKIEQQRFEAEINLDLLKDKLKAVKEKIEEINASQAKLHDEIRKCEERCLLEEIARQHLQGQRDLIHYIDIEDKLMNELQQAQRQACEAELTEQSFSLNINKKIDNMYQMYQTRKEFLTERRILREEMMKRNAEKLRNRVANEIITSLKSDEKLNHRPYTPKVLGKKNAMKKANKYIRLTMLDLHQKKLTTVMDEQLKQKRQYKLLFKLKKEVDAQKDTLIQESQARKRRADAEVGLKEELMQKLVTAGENPYLIDRILYEQEKNRKKEMKVLEIQQDTLTRLTNDLEQEQKEKKKQELKKIKWDRFWAKNLKKRIKRNSLVKQTLFGTKGKKSVNPANGKPSEDSHEVLEVTKKELAQPNYYDRDSSRPTTNVPSATQNSSNATVKTAALEEQITTIQLRSPFAGKNVDAVNIVSNNNLDYKQELIEMVPESDRPSNLQLHPVSRKGESILSLESSEVETPKNSKSTRMETDPSSVAHQALLKALSREIEETDLNHNSVTNEESLFPVTQEELNMNQSYPSISKNSFSREMGSNIKEIKYLASQHGDGDSRRNIQSGSHRANNKASVPAFRWEPKTITFKDYNLGKVYKKKVSVTNITLLRLRYSFKDVINTSSKNSEVSVPSTAQDSAIAITDLVHVDFQAPNPISPGLQHFFYVVFRPISIGDWYGKLKFDSPQGEFEIPIECLKKRVIPVVNPEFVVFKNVVVNTASKLTLKLQNIGAKPGVIQYFAEIINSNDSTASHKTIDYIYPPSSSSSNYSSTQQQSSTDSTLSDQLQQPNKAVVKIEFPDSRSTIESHSALSKKHSDRFKSKSSKPIGISIPEDKHTESRPIVTGILGDIVNTVTDHIFIPYIENIKRDLVSGISRKLCIHFHPPYLDTFKATFKIKFEDPEDEIVIFSVEGHTIENPIHANPMNSDLKICMMDHNYQQLIHISSEYKGCGKVTASVPSALKQYVEVYPKEATVFTYNGSNFCVKFHPKSKMVNDAAVLEFLDIDTHIIDFPISFYLNFPIPLPSPIVTTLMAVVTEMDLEIAPSDINLGSCSSNETVKSTICMRNNAMVPINFGFRGLPQWITLQPNYGFGTILPFETLNCDILVSLPESMTGDHTVPLKCETLQKREYIINLSFQCKFSVIQLSRTKILFPATRIGSVATSMIEIYSTAPLIKYKGNHTSLKGILSKFEFAVGPNVPIVVRPNAGFIEPGKAVKVLISFEADVDDDSVKLHLIKLLKEQYIARQGSLQRELDGLIEAKAISKELIMDEIEGEDHEEDEWGWSENRRFTKIASLPDTSGSEIQNQKRRKSIYIRDIGKISHEKLEDIKNLVSSPSSQIVSEAIDLLETIVNGRGRHSLSNVTSFDAEPGSIVSDHMKRDKKRKQSTLGKIASESKVEIEEGQEEEGEQELEEDLGSRRESKFQEAKKKSSKQGDRTSSETITKTRRRSVWNPKSRKTTKGEHLPIKLRPNPVPPINPLQKQQDEILQKLQEEFLPPKLNDINNDSPEFAAAKVDLMRRVNESSEMYTIPCFVTDPNGNIEVLILTVSCPMLHPNLILLNESLTIDFGKVCLETKVLREVRLLNISQVPLSLRMDIINPYGSFARCNALRKVPSEHIFKLKLSFLPLEDKEVEETVRIFGGDSCIILNLVGCGIIPEFSLKPSKSDIYIGMIQNQTIGSYQFEVNNISGAELCFEIERTHQGHFEGDIAVYTAQDETTEEEHEVLLPSSPQTMNTPPPTATANSSTADGRVKFVHGQEELASTTQNVTNVQSEKESKKRRKQSVKKTGHLQVEKTDTPKETKRKASIAETPEPVTPLPFVGPFEIMDEGVVKMVDLQELIMFLELKKQYVFFQSVPSTLKVKAGETGNFTVYFIPVESGRYFGGFNLRLFNRIVHEFTVVGIGQNHWGYLKEQPGE